MAVSDNREIYLCVCGGVLVSGPVRTSPDHDMISADGKTADFVCAACGGKRKLLRVPRAEMTAQGIVTHWRSIWFSEDPPRAVLLNAPWQTVSDADAIERELAREVGKGHILFGRSLHAMARRADCDDVLFVSGLEAFVVHLTWRGVREEDPRWPSTEAYPSFEAIVRERLEPDAKDFSDD